MQEIQSLLLNWTGPDLTTYGELVLEGTFRVHRVRNEKTFFLFDKVLLITKKRGGHFVYKGHIPVTRPHLLLPRFPPSQRAGSIFQLCARLGWASGWGGRSSTLEEYSPCLP